jgi:hypothetical protein
LLVAIDAAHAEAALRQLVRVAPATATIGRVTSRADHLIVIR